MAGFLGVAGRLPLAAHGAVGSTLAAIICAIPVRGGVIRENLARAFPGAESGAAPSRFQVLRHACMVLLEIAYLRYGRPEVIRDSVEVDPETGATVRRLCESGKGLLMATAHAGNWEWTGVWFHLMYGSTGYVYKPIHNPHIDLIIKRIRTRFGLTPFSTREKIPRDLFRFLRRGGAVGILSDQDARHRGIFVPFFGTPASTDPGLASLAVRLGVPVMFGTVMRIGPGRFRAAASEPVYPDPQADPDAEIERIMQSYNRNLEEVIRQYPDQYFWMHRRWKTQPE